MIQGRVVSEREDLRAREEIVTEGFRSVLAILDDDDRLVADNRDLDNDIGLVW